MIIIFLLFLVSLFLLITYFDFKVGGVQVKEFFPVLFYFILSFYSYLSSDRSLDNVFFVNFAFLFVIALSYEEKWGNKIKQDALLFLSSCLIYFLTKDLYWVYFLSLYTIKLDKSSLWVLYLWGAFATFVKFSFPFFEGGEVLAPLFFIAPIVYLLLKHSILERNFYHSSLLIYSIISLSHGLPSSVLGALILLLSLLTILFKTKRIYFPFLFGFLLSFLFKNQELPDLMNFYFLLFVGFKVREILLLKFYSDKPLREGLGISDYLTIVLLLFFISGCVGTHSSWFYEKVQNKTLPFLGFYLFWAIFFMNYSVIKDHLPFLSREKKKISFELAVLLLSFISLLLNSHSLKNFKFFPFGFLEILAFILILGGGMMKRDLLQKILMKCESMRIEIPFPLIKDQEKPLLNFRKKERTEKPPQFKFRLKRLSFSYIWAIFIFMVGLISLKDMLGG